MTKLLARRTRGRLAISVVLALTMVMGLPMTAHAGAGSSWTHLAPSASPPPNWWHGMTYDETNHELVLFGGQNDSTVAFHDTYTYNGSTWAHETPAHAPTDRVAPSMAFDSHTGTALLFGGTDGDTQYSNETWSWNGTDWTKLSPVHSPPARAWSGLAAEPTSGDLILFGGWNGSADLADTWRWNGTDWLQEAPATSPSGRDDFLMVPDAPHGKIVLFGGELPDGSMAGDTWTWNGTTWTSVATTGPHARTDMYATFDKRLNRPLLFGGYFEDADSFAGYQDTWQWTGTQWAPMAPAVKPSPRDSGSMAYFPPSGRTILFGGYNEFASGDGGLGGTWGLQLSAGTSAPAVSTSVSSSRSFAVSWAAPGTPTGFVVQYATRVKNGAGQWVTSPYTTWQTVGGSVHSATFTGTGGTTYLFRTQAFYAGGATTAFSSPVTSVVPYDDRSPSMSFSSGWTPGTASGRYRGTVHSTTAAGKTMTMKTSAQSFRIIGDKCASCGSMRVYVDNASVYTLVNTHRSTLAARQTLFLRTFNGTGTHTIKIVTMATSGHPKIVIDGVAVQR